MSMKSFRLLLDDDDKKCTTNTYIGTSMEKYGENKQRLNFPLYSLSEERVAASAAVVV